MKRHSNLLCIALLLAACSISVRKPNSLALKGPFLGQTPPGKDPVVFAPGVVSTGMSELNNVFTPDGDEFFFTIREPGGRGVSMMHMVRKGRKWSKPELLPFASRFGDIDMSISPDGNRLFFCSQRSIDGSDSAKGDNDFWMSERSETGWGEPVHLGPDINSTSHDYYPVLSNLGNLYFSSQREGPGTNNIYVSRQVQGHFQKAEKLGVAINSEYRDFDPYIAPDESYLIFASERPGGQGQSDLYISYRNEKGEWEAAVNLGKSVNSEGSEFCPMVTPDGKYLFFTSGRRVYPEFPDASLTREEFLRRHNDPGNLFGDIYWIDAGIIEYLRDVK